jgi:hypothetical protein
MVKDFPSTFPNYITGQTTVLLRMLNSSISHSLKPAVVSQNEPNVAETYTHIIFL